MKNTPEKIYLQINLSDNNEELDDFKDLCGITWNNEKVFKDDLEYYSKEYFREHIQMAFNDGKTAGGLKTGRTAEEYFNQTYQNEAK